MSILVRFGVSLEKELLKVFDKHIKGKGYATRSKAIENLIRQELISKEWENVGSEVAGAITIVFNHHKRDVVNRLTDIQHDFQKIVISTQHVHLSHHICLEVVVVKGNPSDVKKLADKIKAEKGVMHTSLAMSTSCEKD